MNHREAASFVADRLRAAQPNGVERVILYGSVARREERPESDVDLLIVARDFRAVYRALRPILGELFLVRDAPYVSAKVVSSDEFDAMRRRGASFYRNLAAEGEVLVAS